ncbi:MAG: anthranilate synthase component I [Ottowia sp.]|nr:anthranilate synthase component I [Ottowia sp.]
MTEIEFNALANQGYNRIPLIVEALTDLETPLSLYIKLTQGKNGDLNTFLLESVVGGERFGRYSFIGLSAHTSVRSYGQRCEVVTNSQVVETAHENPLDFIERYQTRFRVALRPGLPRFCGGLAGYFGYDTVRHIEPKLAQSTPPDDLGLPDIQLLLTEELAVIDNLASKLYLIVYADATQPEAYEKARERLRILRAQLQQSANAPISTPTLRTEIIREFDKEAFMKAVSDTQSAILAGDAMQVVISQRLIKPYRDAPLSLYRALRKLNPSPYMYFYNFGDMHIVGASPEILVRQEHRQIGNQNKRIVTIRPLAGTRPRGHTPEQDAQFAHALRHDPKEIAEHVMLIDLARNDIGRIAQTGSVKVTEHMAIEKYSHVQHLVSAVEGELKPELSNIDVLKASFPAGTLSGAPKVKAMQMIDQVEITKRGIYGGAVGYLSFNGEMDLAIAIRTGVIKNGHLYVQAGAGIVADSDPENEWHETEVKARAVLHAAEQVQNGLSN